MVSGLLGMRMVGRGSAGRAGEAGCGVLEREEDREGGSDEACEAGRGMVEEVVVWEAGMEEDREGGGSAVRAEEVESLETGRGGEVLMDASVTGASVLATASMEVDWDGECRRDVRDDEGGDEDG